VQAGFLPFEEAQELVRKEGLKSGEEWWEWSRDGTALTPFPPTHT
jgi:hypothetical protein